MPQYEFGSGTLYGRSLSNSPATPVEFGALQGVSIETTFSVKELYGRFQFPIALGRGTAKMTGKADAAQINAQVWNDLFFGYSNPSTGQVKTAVEESGTVTANAVTVTNAANYVRDLGVFGATDGLIYTRVSASPVGRQYTCNETSGVYTFNSSQNNTAVKISYNYTDAANGKTINLTNQLLGNAPSFLAVFTQEFQGKQLTWVLNKCMSSKLGLTTKLEDFVIPSFDFSAFADDSNSMGSLYLSE